MVFYKCLATEAESHALGEQGDEKIVGWALKRGYILLPDVAYGAASKDHVDLVRFLHESQDFDIECKEHLITVAIRAGQLGVSAFVLENVPDCTHRASRDKKHDSINAAGARGDLDAIKFLLERRPNACSPSVMDDAAVHGHFEIVRYLHENRTEGCTTKAMNTAASNGNLQIVRFLHENRTEGVQPELWTEPHTTDT